MDMLQWNVNKLLTMVPDLQVLKPSHDMFPWNSSLSCPYIKNLCDFTAYHYSYFSDNRANGGTTISFKNCIYSAAVHFQVSAVCINIRNLSFTICNIYLPPVLPIAKLTWLVSHYIYIHPSFCLGMSAVSIYYGDHSLQTKEADWFQAYALD